MQNHLSPKNSEDIRFVRMPEVMRITGLGRSTIYKMIREGNLPPLTKLSSRASGMSYPQLLCWVQSHATVR
ncbi:MAG: transcriptional regulator [Betaproteobacteria bacterium HGW-Betaproteobacteria-14]|nr:MAG: transcriptional regulator [Betaproteobacteria bacterium HGW-Betaproteobacteria-14]